MEPPDASGTVEEQINEVLLKRINPSIAAHGGFAELIRVEGNTALVKLGGGCQVCGMANATVTAGIEKTLREAFGELEVIEHFQSYVRFKTGSNAHVGRLFEILEAKKQELDIMQYSIKQASVEQIFNKFAEEDGNLQMD